MSDVDDAAFTRKYGRGHRKLAMVRECAEAKLSWVDIAGKYNISVQRLYRFREENAEAIAEIKSNVDDAMAGLWIAQKHNRVAEYQSHSELVDELIAAGAEQPQVLLKVAQSALRGVAEELGQLSPRDNSERTQVDVRIVGVDSDAL
jgi:hypothetical protein